MLHCRGELRVWTCYWRNFIIFLWHKVVFLHPGEGWTPWHLLNSSARPLPAPICPWCCRGSVGHQTQGCTPNPDLRAEGAKENHVTGVRALLYWPSRSSAALDPPSEIFWYLKDLPSPVLKIDVWTESCVPESWGASHVLERQKVCGGAGDLSWISSWNDWTTFLPSQLTGEKGFRLL